MAPELRGSLKKPPRSLQPLFEFPREAAGPAPAEAAARTFSKTIFGLVVPDLLKTGKRGKWLRLAAVDFAVAELVWLSLGILSLSTRTIAPAAFSQFLGMALLHPALITLLAHSEGLYTYRQDPRPQARGLGKAVLWATALLCVSFQMQGAPLRVAGTAGLLTFFALFGWRRWHLRQQRGAGGERRNVLIVGAGAVERQVAAHIQRHPEEGRVICGFLDDDRATGDGVIGGVSSLARLARKGFIDEVILAVPHDRGSTLRALHEARRLRLDVEFVPDLFGCQPVGEEVARLGHLPVISLHREPFPATKLLAKRVLDVLGASAALLLSAPLLVAVAAVIKLDSSGQVIYAAQRAGKKGRLFRCYKFRTMVSNADALKNRLRYQNERAGALFKIGDDPRITRIGRILRRFSLDELPQLWNVLKGDMSLVGPRPHPLDDFLTYGIEDLARLDVTPGITGLWQVSARRDPSFRRSVELDREYIQTWNLALDMKILLKTIVAVVQGSGD